MDGLADRPATHGIYSLRPHVYPSRSRLTIVHQAIRRRHHSPRIPAMKAVSDRWSGMGFREGGPCETKSTTTGTLLGHARVSTDAQDLTAQRDALSATWGGCS